MNRYEFYSNLQAYNDHQNELKHYGIAGQKWGTRRWQFADGRFNEAGKERYFGTKSKNSGSDENPKIGGLKDFTAKNFVFMNDKHVFKKIKENPEYYETEGLDDKDIMQAIRRVDKIQYSTDGSNYGVRLRNELHKAVMEKKMLQNQYNVNLNDNKLGQSILDSAKNVNTKDVENEISGNNNDLSNEEINHAVKFGGYGNIQKSTNAAISEMRAEQRVQNETLKELDDYFKDENSDTPMSDIIRSNQKIVNKLIEYADKGKDKKYFNELYKIKTDMEKDFIEEYVNAYRSKRNEKKSEYMNEYYDEHFRTDNDKSKIFTTEEKKEIKKAKKDAFNSGYEKRFALAFLFGPFVSTGVAFATVSKAAKQLGLNMSNLDDFNASDWKAIDKQIRENRHLKPREE